jgi:pimeloyl-ACP methyl ester carboxylesterase
MLRKIGIGFAILIGIAIIALIVFRTPDIPAETLRAKYANAESEFIEVEPGLTLHVRDAGPADAPVVVLVHGSSASLQTWEGWAERLKDRYRVISYDQAGHGLTGPHPRDCYTAACFVQVLEWLRAAKRIDRFVVAGNSMGGWVAWNYALAHPDRLAGMILVDASGAPVQPKKLPIGFRIAFTPVVRDIVRNVTPRAVIQRSLEQTVADPSLVTPARVDTYWELLRYPGNRRATALRMDVLRAPTDRASLARIATPTLIMWGAKDTLIPVAAADFFADGLPNDKSTIYDDLGHIPQEEDPVRSARDAAAFIEGLRAPA